jgi:hypothetical protein
MSDLQGKEKPFSISITDFGGFCPAWFENAYPFYGNRNQASDMTNISLIDPNVLTQGPGMADLTNGTQAGAVTTLIKHILPYAVASNSSYAIGGAKLYQITATTVTNAGIWPHTIDKAAVTDEDGECVIYHNGKIYYFYNHSGSAGDIGTYDLTTTFDDDWGSTVPIDAEALEDAPHQAIKGGDDGLYFANGQYIGSVNPAGTVLETQALDFWSNAEVASLTWNNNRIIAAVNRPNIAGANFNQSGIYNWDTVAPSWEGDPVEVEGKIGALYTKNGITFVWWQDSSDSGGYSFGYITGGQLSSLKRFKGSLPLFYQVGEYKGFLAWVSDSQVYLWGAKDTDVPVVLFQYCEGKQATIGAIASPFNDLLISSYATTNFSLAKPSGYVVDSSYKTMAFRTSGAGVKFQIDIIQVETEQLSTGAQADFTLTYDKGKSTKTLESIKYSTANTTRHKILNRSLQVEDFRLDIDFSNGSATNPVKVRSIFIEGHHVLDK